VVIAAGVLAVALAVAALLSRAAGAALAYRAALARAPAPAAPMPALQAAELRYATRPAPGVWAEVKVILDSPLPDGPAAATHAALLVPGTFFEDFAIRSTEPLLVAPPRRRSDGRYALLFPAPLAQSLNWYRLELVVRRSAPRPVQVGIMIDRPLFETRTTKAAVRYVDEEADPFKVVPAPLVAWLPDQPRTTLPLLLTFTLALGVTVAAGCAAAFRAVRR